MTAVKGVPDGHLFYAIGSASDAGGHRFFKGLPDPKKRGLNDAQKLACYILHAALRIPQNQIAKTYEVDVRLVRDGIRETESYRERNLIFDEFLNSAERLAMVQFGIG